MSKFNAIIVDDEVMVRTQIKSLVDWQTTGFDIVGEADNGEQAKALVKILKPNLVITDMNMPIVDGVEFINWLECECESISIIAISGFDDFRYVKSCFKSGAIDYLLKHQLNKENLLNTLNAAKKSIESKMADEKIRREHDFYLKQNSKTVMKESLLKLVVHPYNQNGTNNVFNGDDFKNSIMIVVDFDDTNRNIDSERLRKISQTLEDIIEKIIEKHETAYVFKEGIARCVIIICFANYHSHHKIYNEVQSLIMHIRLGIKKYLNKTACYAVSNIIHDYTKFYDVYKKISGYFSQRFIQGYDQIFMLNDSIDIQESKKRLELEKESSFLKALKLNDLDVSLSIIDEIFNDFNENKIDQPSAIIAVCDLLHIILDVMKEREIEICDIFGDDINPYQYVQSIETLIVLKEWCIDVIKSFYRFHSMYKNNCKNSTLINNAMQFIHKNYREDISLNEVADKVGVSPSYLSREFKDKCNTNYIKYLNEYRIERAKILLLENRSFKEVAELTGFNHYNYFFKVFKDYTGMTPQEFIANVNKS